MATVRDHFKPEFLNRLDELIVFHRLEGSHLKQIVDVQLTGLTRRLSERGIVLDVKERAKEYIARKGYDPAYGARPIKRLIQREVENPLAAGLLDGTFGPGSSVVVDGTDDGLVLAATPE